MFFQNFNLKIILNFPTFCWKRQLFLVSIY
jgi:hypothetical protein